MDEVDLAIRDIKIAFELGCLGSELLDFLLAHHVTDDKEEEEAGAAVLEKSVDALYNPDVPGSQKKLFVSKLKEDLESIKRSRNKKRVPSEVSVALIEEQVRNLVNMQHSESDGNGEADARGEELALLDEDERHFIYPSLSSCVDVVVDEGEARAGRRIVAQMELDVGEVVAVEEPNTILFCPNSKLASRVRLSSLDHFNQSFNPSLTASLAQEPLRALFVPLRRPSPVRELLRRVVLLRAVQGGGRGHVPQIRVQNEALRDASLYGRRIHGYFHGDPHHNAETGELLSEEKGPHLGVVGGQSSGGKRYRDICRSAHLISGLICFY